MRARGILLLLLLSAASVLPAAAAVSPDSGIENLRQTGKAFAAVAREVSPAVVFLQVEKTREVRAGSARQQLPGGDDLLEHFFGQPFRGAPRREEPAQERHSLSQGSGFVFTPRQGALPDRSYILTANHVIEGADRIQVKFQDGRSFDARVRGRDPKSDVAVIEIMAGGLPALELGDSDGLEVGEWVVAIGNPFGLSHTLTVGVVSAKGRTSLGISDYEDFIQTDAAINPGNSGGPLVNLEGRVVGINTAIFSRSGGYMGVGFAIPSNLASSIAEQLIASGAVVRGYLGIVIQSLTPELAESFGLQQAEGVLIAEVEKDSPAQRAGLRQGDVVVAYQGGPITDVGAFRNQVSLTAPGSRQQLTVMRAGERTDIEVVIGTLGEEPLQESAAIEHADALGLTVQTLTPQLAEQFGAAPGEGVVVSSVSPGSVAAAAGIQPGSVILQVDQKPVDSAAGFNRAVREAGAQRRVLLLIRAADSQHYVVLRW